MKKLCSYSLNFRKSSEWAKEYKNAPSKWKHTSNNRVWQSKTKMAKNEIETKIQYTLLHENDFYWFFYLVMVMLFLSGLLAISKISHTILCVENYFMKCNCIWKMVLNSFIFFFFRSICWILTKWQYQPWLLFPFSMFYQCKWYCVFALHQFEMEENDATAL